MAIKNNFSFKSSKMLFFGQASKKSVQTLLVTSMILGSLLVLTGGAVAESSTVTAWPGNIPWENYTIAGEPVRDYEDKPYENDPTHGIANVQPKEVDIASGVDASGGGAENNPGNYTSVQWYYWDQFSDTDEYSNLEDDWLFLRMRVADDPRHGGKYYYSAYHWDILFDTDGDIWKEFVVDINGGDGYYKFGTVGVYYNDNETYEYEPNDDMIWAAEASTTTNDYTRALAIDYGPSYEGITQYWIEYRIPVTSFKDKSGDPQLSIDTPFRLFFSTSASMTNPLQKDWMAEYVFATPPNITVEKSVEEAYVDPSDVIHYKIYYNNTGESNTGISYINDTLSEYVTYHSSSIPFSYNLGNIYTWKFDTISPGNHTLYLNVTANKYLISGTKIINYVHFNYTDEKGTPFPDSEDSVTSIVTAPEFELEKLVYESEAYPGDTLHYEINFNNTAAGCAKQVWVIDNIPVGTTYKSASPTYYSMSNNKIIWYFENYCPGKKIIYLTVTANTDLADGLVLNNSAELQFNDANGNLYPKLYSWAETTIIKPHFMVNKTAYQLTADPGDIVEYTIKLINDGNGSASQIWINDTIPSNMTYVSATPAYTSFIGNVISWYFTNVAPGEYLITLKLQVDVGTLDGTILKNNVKVNYLAGPNLPYPEEEDFEEVIVTAPIVDISKEADVSVADPGDVITYTLKYKNTGTGVAGHIWINDTIPPKTSYVSSDPKYTSVSGNTYTWHFIDVKPGSYEIELKVSVDIGISDGTRLENEVTMDYTDANGNPYEPHSDEAIVIVTSPILSISKVADVTTADPSDIITYNITYINIGTGVSGHVWINDTIPADTTFVSSVPGYTSVSDDTYTWHFTGVATGTYWVILKVRVDVGTADGTTLANQVTLDYTDANGNQPYPIQVASATVIVTAPIMTISKFSDVNIADPSDIITYTITFKNLGTGIAGEVVIKDTIPVNTSYVSSSPTYTSHSGDIYTWIFYNVKPGTYNITMDLKVDVDTADGVVLVNKVTLDYTDQNYNPYEQKIDYANVTTTAPIMTFSKDADVTTADPEDVITYTIEFHNTGTGLAGKVWIKDTIPTETSYVSSSPKYTSVAANTFTWYYTNLKPGDYKIIIKVRVDEGTKDETVLVNEVTLDYTDANGNPFAQQHDSATVIVTAPIMTITKVADVKTADPGDSVIYTLEYINKGTGVAAHVWVNDTIPADTTYVTSTPAYTSFSSDTYTWHFKDVRPGTYRITLEVKVDVDTDDGSNLVNEVTMDYTDANSNPYVQQKATATVIVTAPIMTINKVADVKTADPSDVIIYTIEYKNTGTGAAKYVWVNDTIPGKTVYISSIPTYSSVSGNTHIWLFNNVKTGDYTITLKVRVKVGTADETPLTNLVTLDYTDANGNQPYAQDSDTATVIVTAPIMTVGKFADVSTADPDDIITYTIKYENSGTGVAGLVWINDTIAPNTTYASSSPAYTSAAGDDYTWKINNVKTGVYYITLIVRVDVSTPDKTLLVNKVTLDYTDANKNPYPLENANAKVIVTSPIMSIRKDATVTTADPGDIVTYTLYYINTGTGNASKVYINDTIPSETVFHSSTPPFTSKTGNLYSWLFTNVSTGNYSITIKLQVKTGTKDKARVVNYVNMEYSDANDNFYPAVNDTAIITTTAPVMTISKNADVKTADPGDIITYTITYTNTGTGTAGRVWINDTIPANTKYVSSAPTHTSSSGNTYTWLFKNVKTGTYKVTLKVMVKTGTGDGTVLTNDVSLDYTDANGGQPYPTQDDSTDVTATAPVMSISKVSDVPTANPGDIITYTITYTNTGTGVAGYVWINDTVPNNTIFVSSIPGHTSKLGNIITWLFKNVKTGTYAVTLKVRVMAGTADKEVLTNNVSLDYTDANGGQPYPTQYHEIDVTVTAPVMDIKKEVSSVSLNTYIITDFKLRIAGEKWHDVTLSLYDGNQSVGFASITRYPGSPDDQAVTIFDVKVNARSGAFYAIIEYTPEDDPINGQKWGANPCWLTLIFEDDTSVRLKHTFNVRHNNTWVWKIDNFEPYTAKAPLTYEVVTTYNITYNNTGTGIAGHVWVNDTIPAGTTFINSTPDFISMAGNTYTWYFANVKPGTYHIMITTAKLITKTTDFTIITLLNNVTLEYTDINGNQPYPTKRAQAKMDIKIPLMNIVKTVSPNNGKYGDKLTVTLQVNNNLANATMIDYLPLELNYTGNAMDDDGDGLVDEETKDGVDNDGDGRIDEDLGNFRLNGKTVTSGLVYTGHNLSFYPVPTGKYTITFEIIIAEKTLIKHTVTNLAQMIYNNIVVDQGTSDITCHVYNSAPTAIISHPEDGSKHYEDVPISFNSDGSCDDGLNITYYWDFGDGNTSSEKNPTHTYSKPGVYNISLTITDNASNSTTYKIQLIILRSIPKAKIIKPTKLEFDVGQNITFEGKALYNGNYSTLNYSWDLGDNTSNYGKLFIHRYLTVGEYQITFTVTDADGDFGIATITLIIVNTTDDDNNEKPNKPDKLEKPNKPEDPEHSAHPEHPEHPEHPTKPEKPEKPDNPKQNNKYKAKNQPSKSAFKPEAPFYGLPDFDELQPNVPAIENSQSESGANGAVASSGFVAKNYQMPTNGSSSKKKDEENPENSSNTSGDNNENNDDEGENNDNNDEEVTGE